MLYEISSRRTVIDKRGNDKSLTEHFLVDKIELFAEAEQKGLELYNGENDIVAIKRSNIYEIVNKRKEDDERIYLASIESLFVDDDGNESTTKYVVALFAKTLQSATTIALDYMKQGLEDMTLVGIKKSKFEDIIK
jgi:hypothetical protein